MPAAGEHPADATAVDAVLTASRSPVDQATARRRAPIADILAKLPADTQRAVAWALRAFADVAGEGAPAVRRGF